MKTKMKYIKRLVAKKEDKIKSNAENNVIKISAEIMYQQMYSKIRKLSRRYRVKVSKEIFTELVLYCYAFDFGELVEEEILNRLKIAINIAKIDKKRELDTSSIIKIFEQYIDGFKYQRSNNIDYTKLIAYHEVGHYIVNKEMNQIDGNVEFISIIPIEECGGVNIMAPKNENMIYDMNQSINLVAMLLAGDISCELFLNKKNEGISSDYQEATQEIWKVILGTRARKNRRNLKQRGSYVLDGKIRLDLLSNEQKNDLSKQTNKLLAKAERKAKRTLKKRRKQVEILVEALLERGALTGKQADMLYEGKAKLSDLSPPKIDYI